MPLTDTKGAGVSKSRGTSSRKRPISCYFCRSRKLRCSRQFPCTNCVPRGIQCHLYTDETEGSPGTPQTSPLSNAPGPDILERLHNLEELVGRQQGISEAKSIQSISQTHSQALQPPPPRQQPFPDYSASRDAQSLTTEFALLDKVSTGEISTANPSTDKIVFQTCPLQQVLTLSSVPFLSHGTSPPVRRICLPRYGEAKILLEKYLDDITYAHHVIHVPMLRAILDQLYTDLEHQAEPRADQVSLILAILASATLWWTSKDCPPGFHLSPADAESQTPLWVRATLDVLHHVNMTSCPSLEVIQAMIILGFVMGNLEGISRRYRTLFSMALTLGRELGLHLIDQPRSSPASGTSTIGTVQKETRRRVWWYLASTDWFLSRYPGPTEGMYTVHPGHMVVSKPLNLNDEDVGEDLNLQGKPLTEATFMSYFIQRLRLAELCRDTADRASYRPGGFETVSYGNVLYVDAELNEFLDALPSFFALEYQASLPIPMQKQKLNNTLTIQRYLLHNITHTQRCKLHLPYLLRSSVKPAYAYSRQACLISARRIIQNELIFEKQEPPFPPTRLKFTGILYGLFMANIVFLLDACLDRNAAVTDKESIWSDVVEASRILQEAEVHSPAAVKLSQSMKQIRQKYKLAWPETKPRWTSNQHDQSADHDPSTASSDYTESTATSWSQPLTQENDKILNSFDVMFQGFEGSTDFVDMDWDAIFSGLDPSVA